MNNQQNKILWNLWDIFYAITVAIISFVFSTGIFLYFSLDNNTVLFNFLVQIIVSFSLITSIFCILKIKYKLSLKEVFGFYPKKYKYHLKYTAFAFFGILLATALISYFFTKFSSSPPLNPYEDLPLEKIQVLTYISVFLSPFAEEVFFRGIVQPFLVQKTGRILGIAITSFIFATAHFQYLCYDYAFLIIFSIGTILGLTKERTSSIFPGMAAHFLNNLLACTALF